MNNKLEEKLLYKKAEKYANQLKGLESFTLSYIEGKDFIWHKKQLSNVNKLDSNISGMVFNHPVDEGELIEYVFNILKDRNITLLFEGRIAIHLSIKNISIFLRDFFERQKSYDLSLFFVDPDKILVISDDEYSLSVYCCN